MPRIDIAQLSRTIEIVKARNIQKTKVDQNKMIGEMQAEVAIFYKQIVKDVNKIITALDQVSTERIFY